MTNPYEHLHVAHGREENKLNETEKSLDYTVEILSCLPLKEEHYSAVAEHLSSLEWNEEQQAALDKVIITLALNGNADYTDVACILTQEDVMKIIEKELTK